MPRSSSTSPVDQVVHDEVQGIPGQARAAYIQRDYDRAEQLDQHATERVVRALRAYQHGKGGFADCLIGSRAHDAGCSTVLTFDRARLAEAGFESP